MALHWFLMEQRTVFKVLLLTCKAINNLASPSISQLLVRYNPPRSLRSAGKHLLEVPKACLKTHGDRAFSVAAPKLWNDLASEIKFIPSIFFLQLLLDDF